MTRYDPGEQGRVLGRLGGWAAWGTPVPTTLTHHPQVAKLPFVINDGKWHHICVTWTTRDGVWEAYQDGTQTGSGENLAPYHPIKPQGVLVLGQEQVRAGGGGECRCGGLCSAGCTRGHGRRWVFPGWDGTARPHAPPMTVAPPQDTLGGGFDATQAFVGELAHFNVWDRKLSPGEVYSLATCSTKALAGNVIAWAEANIDIYGGATKWTFEACRQLN